MTMIEFKFALRNAVYVGFTDEGIRASAAR
jgi:hypothetical protein